MTTIIQIGNSDDRLTQKEWSEFCAEVDRTVRRAATAVHFYGHPPGDMPWQNAAWIVEISIVALGIMTERLVETRKKYRQDSIAITSGSTHFI